MAALLRSQMLQALALIIADEEHTKQWQADHEVHALQLVSAYLHSLLHCSVCTIAIIRHRR